MTKDEVKRLAVLVKVRAGLPARRYAASAVAATKGPAPQERAGPLVGSSPGDQRGMLTPKVWARR